MAVALILTVDMAGEGEASLPEKGKRLTLEDQRRSGATLKRNSTTGRSASAHYRRESLERLQAASRRVLSGDACISLGFTCSNDGDACAPGDSRRLLRTTLARQCS